MTAQKKDSSNKAEQKHHADNNGWTEVKRTRDKEPNKSSPKEGGPQRQKAAAPSKKNQFDVFKDSKSEKAPKQKELPKQSQPKPKSVSPPKQRTVQEKPAKTAEVGKSKKSSEAKVSLPKPKPAQVPAKTEKIMKDEKPVKTTPAPKSNKATIQKDSKKSEGGRGKRKSSMGDLCKQLFHWCGVALLVVSVLAAMAVAYQQHKIILEDTVTLHKQEMHELKISLTKDVFQCQEEMAKTDQMLLDTQEELKKLNVTKKPMDPEAAKEFHRKLKEFEQEYFAKLEPLLQANLTSGANLTSLLGNLNKAA